LISLGKYERVRPGKEDEKVILLNSSDIGLPDGQPQPRYASRYFTWVLSCTT
jgi:hypothetical protein